MTYKYYATKALRYIRQQYLKKEWCDYMSLPREEQILERGAVLIAQWCQPNVNVTLDDVSKRLDQIADLVRYTLYSSYPNHPLFSTPLEVTNEWKYRNLDQNKWSVADCRKIMDYMGVVLYKTLGFHGNNEMYYVPENSYINEVHYVIYFFPYNFHELYIGFRKKKCFADYFSYCLRRRGSSFRC